MRKRYRAITLDLFGTVLIQDLGDDGFAEICAVCSIEPDLARPLIRAFEAELREEFKLLLDRDTTQEEIFPTLRSMFELTFRRLSERFGADFDAANLTGCLMESLAQTSVFPETLPILEQLEKEYPICFVSDADIDMVKGTLSSNGLDRFPAVISEEHRAYKISPNSPLFPKALEILGAKAEETIHAGDQASDVYGAHQAGIDCVYINRKGKSLMEGIPSPVIEVPDLQGFVDWLRG
ncbi:MAG: HAD hydrolase-like protein [bacterium]